MKKFSLALLAAATALAITPAAKADTLINVGPDPTSLTLVLVDTLKGSLVSHGGSSPTYTASYTENVYTYNAAGDLAFQYDITNAGHDADSIDNFSTNYGGYTNGSLEFYNETPGVPISDATQNDGSGSITVNFAPPDLSDGVTSDFILYTDATAFGSGPIAFNDTFPVSGTAVTPTPEPSSLLLLGSGLFGLAFVVFRKAKSSGLVLRP